MMMKRTGAFLSPAGRLAIVAIALAAIGIIVGDMIGRSHQAGYAAAKAIVAGERQARILSDDDAGDQNLGDDMRAAGGLWAERHKITDAAACRGFAGEFREGFIGAVKRPKVKSGALH
jgi:hypothetical protein